MSLHELISDLAIIPAFELYAAGMITAFLLCALLMYWDENRK